MASRPDRDADEHRRRGQERVEPGDVALGHLTGDAPLAQEPRGGQRDADDRRLEHEATRADATTGRILALEVASGAPRERPGGGQQERGRGEGDEDRADRRHRIRSSGHRDGREQQPEQGGRDRDQEPFPELGGEQLA